MTTTESAPGTEETATPAPLRPGTAVARVAGGLALLYGTLLVLRPFLIPLAWAAIVAYVTWPLFERARRWSGRPHVVAALFTSTVLFVLGVPVAGLLVALADQSTQLASVTQEWLNQGAPLPTWVANLEWAGPRLEALRQQLLAESGDVASYVTTYSAAVADRLVALAGGIAGGVFAFVITLIALYALYIDGERITGHARRLAAAVFPQTPPEFLDNVGAVVRAVVFGLLGTALVQGLIAGIGFVIFGVPQPVALGALTAFASFIPVGPALVWGAAAAWLSVVGETGKAIGMALWGLLLVSSVDNVLRPLLISRSGATRIPFLLIFLGVLGGLTAFGMLGLFLGPVLLSVTFALIAEWPPHRTAQPAAAPTPAPPPTAAAPLAAEGEAQRER